MPNGPTGEDIIDPRRTQRGERLKDRTVAITGRLSSMTGDEAKEAIRMQGGRASSSVSSGTDYLVVGDDPGQNKIADAREQDVDTIDEEEFARRLGRNYD